MQLEVEYPMLDGTHDQSVHFIFMFCHGKNKSVMLSLRSCDGLLDDLHYSIDGG